MQILQHIAGFEPPENLRYPIYITTQKGESEPIDSPFLLPQSSIFRAFNLTPDLKMRYGADIHLVSAILGENLIVGFLSMYHQFQNPQL